MPQHDIDEQNQLNQAINYIKMAARLLYKLSVPDTHDAAVKLDEILLHDNGKAGLVVLAREWEDGNDY